MSSVTLPRQPSAAAEAAPAAPEASRQRRSRAKPRRARARLVVTSELRALAAFQVEWALLDRTARPQGAVIEWADRLAAELDVEGVGRPQTNGQLFFAIKDVIARSEADPERPLVALPPAA